MKFAIGITTFKKRFKSLSRLVNAIRNQGTFPIVLAVNGEYDSDFDESYRQDILELAASTPYCSVVMFPKFRCLAKLWNTILQASPCEWNLILNDDVHITKNYFDLNTFYTHIKIGVSEDTVYPINGSWSHFFVNKNTIEDLGWFDERLLGLGEEDSDMFWRLLWNGYNIYKVFFDGIFNLPDGSELSGVKKGIDHYSAYNNKYIKEKYESDPDGMEGMFQEKKIQKIQDINLYPGEMIYRKNNHKLTE